MKEKYYVIANNDDTKFIGKGKSSDNSPFVTEYFRLSYIGLYEVISAYYDIHSSFVDKDKFFIKRIVLEDISTD
jgi:hypothetical protein